MLDEGKKLTAFDAMEAAMKLSGMYIVHRTHDFVTFRFSTMLEAVEFEFGKWEGYEIIEKASYRVYLNELTISDSFSDVFQMIENELDRMEEIIKEKRNELQST